MPVSERLEGTLVTTVIAVMKGAMFVRVHDVKENIRVIKMTEAIIYQYRSSYWVISEQTISNNETGRMGKRWTRLSLRI